MERAVIIHGMPSRQAYYDKSRQDSESNSHWIPWLQQKLCQMDVLTQTPEMPRPFNPNYELWKNEFEKQKPDISTLVVGHSCGGGFIIRWLSENPNVSIGKAVLVAPWIDIENSNPEMFTFSICRTIANQCVNGIHIVYSTNDAEPMRLTLDKLRQELDSVKYHKFTDYGHFTFGAMKTREFPELLDICKS